MSASSSRRQQPKKGQAPQPQTDPWWLDEPIRRPWGRRLGKDFNPNLAWLMDRLPGRARALIMRAACGEVYACGKAPSECPLCGRCEPQARCQAFRRRQQRRPEDLRPRLPAVRTLREFIALPAMTLLLQPRYGYQTHMALCRALRANGVTGLLFGFDEERLLPHYPYLPPTPDAHPRCPPTATERS